MTQRDAPVWTREAKDIWVTDWQTVTATIRRVKRNLYVYRVWYTYGMIAADMGDEANVRSAMRSAYKSMCEAIA